MELDGRSLPPSIVLDADLCVIGGGVAGITLVRQFVGQAVKVLLIESGGRSPSEDTQKLCAGENIGFSYYALDEARARCLAGSSSRWHVPIGENRLGARLRALDPMDFEERAWVSESGWPFGYRELAAYYERACDFCEVGAGARDPARWSGETLRSPSPFPPGELKSILFRFCDREVFINKHPRELIRAENVICLLHATVLRLFTNETGDLVTGLEGGTLGGNHFIVQAKQFVLAAGGLDVPRLLLVSDRTRRQGIGNDHGIVGRYFMEHIHFWSGVLVPETEAIFAQARRYSELQKVNGAPALGKLALPERVIRERRLLNQNVQLIPIRLPDPFRFPRMSGYLAEALHASVHPRGMHDFGRNVGTVLSRWKELTRVIVKRIQRKIAGLPDRPVFILANMAEQTPKGESRVLLGDQLDAFGVPMPKLDWRISAQDIRSVCETHAYIDEVMRRSGIGRLYRELHDDQPPGLVAGRHPQSSAHGGYHHMGTTRMHVDPKRGVVDANCRVHAVSNLYIAGPSVFPTGGYANPALTIVALTLRLADHLKARRFPP